jgi:23S rRNA pseudouridine1911/1915/1917 synthase
MGKNYSAGDEPESESDWGDSISPQALSAAMPVGLAGLRLDQALAKLFPQYSRSRLQVWLKAGQVSVDGGQPEGSATVLGGERVEVRPPATVDGTRPPAQKMRLAVVFEDTDLIVIDKPAGLIVHPGAGNPDHTLMNGLLAHASALRQVPRAGIVHRLDKDTSGLLVIAKNLTAQASLAAQLAERSVKRTYLAVVHGEPPASGTVDEPIGRDTRHRTRMAVTRRGKDARTHFRVLERFERSALVECRLETGRTHQIRVHLQHLKHPVVGDPVYQRGSRPGIEFPRQALHAAALELVHPRTGKPKGWESPLPADMKKLIAGLRRGS